MKPGRIAAWTAAAIVVPGLAACGGSSSGGDASPVTSSSVQATASAAPSESGRAGGLTRPGAHLGFGQQATVGWVPPSTALAGSGAQKGLKLRVTVESIKKGTMADFKNVQLSASERHSTPYYVTVRITALSSRRPHGTDDPDVTFDAIDDRGQQQESITFLGTFQRCDDKTPPRPFTNGKSYHSCLAYLIPGGGSIQKVQWNNGPNAADEVSPYFDKPIVWAGN